MKSDFKNWSYRILCLFLATDLVFIILHVIHIYVGVPRNNSFSIEEERGYAEIFQYLKEYWIVLILGFIAFRQRSFIYLGWFFLFFYMLLDDSLQIHEKLGLRLSIQLHFLPSFNLRAEDFGELMVSGFFGLFLLFFIATAYRFSDRLSRKISRYFIKMLLVLALFGIVFDMIHAAIKLPTLQPIFGLLEDGGEMIVISIIACFVLFLPDRLNSASFGNSLNVQQEILPINR